MGRAAVYVCLYISYPWRGHGAGRPIQWLLSEDLIVLKSRCRSRALSRGECLLVVCIARSPRLEIEIEILLCFFKTATDGRALVNGGGRGGEGIGMFQDFSRFLTGRYDV